LIFCDDSFSAVPDSYHIAGRRHPSTFTRKHILLFAIICSVSIHSLQHYLSYGTAQAKNIGKVDIEIIRSPPSQDEPGYAIDETRQRER
jgi:hypothetical protein